MELVKDDYIEIRLQKKYQSSSGASYTTGNQN